MKLTILVLLLLFSLGFFTIAYFQQEARRGGYAVLTGFLILLFSGLFVSASGIEYKTGSTVTQVGSVSTIVYDYDSLSSTENLSVGLPLILAGFWGLLVVISALRSTRYDEE